MHQYKDIALMILIWLTKSNALNKTNRLGNMDIISEKKNYTVLSHVDNAKNKTLVQNIAGLFQY